MAYTFTTLSSVIPKIAGKYGLKKDLDASRICLTYNRLVEEEFGFTPPISLARFVKHDTLFVSTPHGAAAQEVTLRKEALLLKLRREVAPLPIRDIKISVKKAAKDSH